MNIIMNIPVINMTIDLSNVAGIQAMYDEFGVASQELLNQVAVSEAQGFHVILPQKSWRQLPNRSIVGLRDGRVQGHAILTDYTDFDTYPDGAILRLVNATGVDVTVTGLAIIGKPVMCYKDAYVWERKDDESIEANGEASLSISNSYMIDPEQIEDLGDYLEKAFDARPVYGLSIPGCHYEYEVGDVWHLSLDYTINGQASECELIDTDVEIESIAFSRSVGGIGETRLVCMPPMGAWTKTTSTRSKLISAGMAQWLNNRGNEVLVAASTWTGQADYYCDGTDDDVEIQAAIDAMYARGGGTVFLTNGTFYTTTRITAKSNIIINGAGSSTILIKADASDNAMIVTAAASTNIVVSNLIVDGGSNNSIVFSTIGVPTSVVGIVGLSSTARNLSCYNVTVRNFEYDGDESAVRYIVGFLFCYGLYKCNVENLVITNQSSGYVAQARGFSYCTEISACASDTLEANAAIATNEQVTHFSYCMNLNNCVALEATSFLAAGYGNCNKMVNCLSDNSAAGSTTNAGYAGCTSVQQCQSLNNTVHYSASYADAGTSNACADTAAGGYNS